MNKLIDFFTISYENQDYFIRAKAKHTTFMLLLICFSVIIESFIMTIFRQVTVPYLVANFIATSYFLFMLFILCKNKILIAGNMFIFAGVLKLVDFFPMERTNQFYLQCFLGLIVCIAIYIKPYQLYLTMISVISFVLVRFYLDHSRIYTDIIIEKNYLHQVYQANAGVFIFCFCLIFYDRIIRQEILTSYRLKVVSETDQLTGLHNRQKFNAIIEKYYDHHQPFYLAIIDVDYFKHINDDFGHLVGDEVLKNFSLLLQDHFTGDDLPFRWGGEEFAVISSIPRSRETFYRHLESFKEKVSQHDFGLNQSVTISIGYVHSSHFYQKDILIQADKALYQAKDAGRNLIYYIDKASPERI